MNDGGWSDLSLVDDWEVIKSTLSSDTTETRRTSERSTQKVDLAPFLHGLLGVHRSTVRVCFEFLDELGNFGIRFDFLGFDARKLSNLALRW